MLVFFVKQLRILHRGLLLKEGLRIEVLCLLKGFWNAIQVDA